MRFDDPHHNDHHVRHGDHHVMTVIVMIMIAMR